LSWAPDGLSFTVSNNKKIRLLDFCTVHHTALAEVKGQVDEMMLGWEPVINLLAVQDDLTCRIPSWSFLDHTDNNLAFKYKALSRQAWASSFSNKPGPNTVRDAALCSQSPLALTIRRPTAMPSRLRHADLCLRAYSVYSRPCTLCSYIYSLPAILPPSPPASFGPPPTPSSNSPAVLPSCLEVLKRGASDEVRRDSITLRTRRIRLRSFSMRYG
jgi:hypothetical protein